MKTLDNLENIQGGDFIDGLCGSLGAGWSMASFVYAAGQLSWIAVVPGVGQSAAVLGLAAGLTCAASAVLD